MDGMVNTVKMGNESLATISLLKGLSKLRKHSIHKHYKVGELEVVLAILVNLSGLKTGITECILVWV